MYTYHEFVNRDSNHNKHGMYTVHCRTYLSVSTDVKRKHVQNKNIQNPWDSSTVSTVRIEIQLT
jgi:hypothetical protein